LKRRLILNEPEFTTSPAFIEREFGARCGELMAEEYDPEKQLNEPHNPALRAYVKEYRNWLLGRKPNFLIHDIGREYRDVVGLEKTVTDGKSTWQSKGEVGNRA